MSRYVYIRAWSFHSILLCKTRDVIRNAQYVLRTVKILLNKTLINFLI